MRKHVVAVVQMTVGSDLSANVEQAISLARDAIERGADWIALPESYCGIGSLTLRNNWAFDPAHPERSPCVAPFVEIARTQNRWLILGGVPERGPTRRLYNTALVVGPAGVLGGYRKIHLFDALPGDGPPLQESRTTAPGERLVLAALPSVRLGLSICYDLRFPELYRALLDGGAEAFVVPAAFTATTGAAHWEALLRARAIENQVYVVAPALVGPHPGGRASHGHAMVVDPWGRIVAELGEPQSGVLLATLDPEVVAQTRARLPATTHRRLNTGTPVSTLGPDSAIGDGARDR